jgi:hypothetical protein
MAIHDAAMRFIAYVVAKGDCPQEVLDQFLKDTKDSRYLFKKDVEGYLRTLANEALWVHLGKQKQESLASTPPSKEFQKSVDAWGKRLIRFTEQPNEVRKRFDPFLRIRD